MRILLLNQTFHPDVVATAQYLTQLAVALAERGHRVTVVASRRGYDAQELLFPRRETWRGIDIHRILSSRLGKSGKGRRAVDFATFMLNCAGRVFTLPRHDVVVALTSPPLISLLGAVLARLRGSRFIYWVMDLNPDEAVAAGWLSQNSLAARALEALSRFSLRHAARIVVLDRFVKERLRAKGIDTEKIAVIPTWSLDDAVQFDVAGRKAFRKQHGLEGKFVVMYSGNHSPCHPLDTLLEAARALATDTRIRFLFVGGGSGFSQVQAFARAHGLSNIQCLPYQPIERLSASLSAADMHVVVMGAPFVGIIHPCKIYNSLRIVEGAGRPARALAGGRVPTESDDGSPSILYIGPKRSHISELLQSQLEPSRWGWAEHGDVTAVRTTIMEQAARQWLPPVARSAPLLPFSKSSLLPQLIAAIEQDGVKLPGPQGDAKPGRPP